MMKLNKIEKLFFDKAIIRFGTFLLAPKEAIEFIDECKKQNMRILGVDGFYLYGAAINPSLERCIDFTSSRYKPSDINEYEEAKNLIKVNGEMFFEIVIA